MSLGEPGERLRSGWCNLYLQGWYHRAGKAGTMTLHPGDLYPTKEAALADIDPEAPYIATAFVQWEHNVLDAEPMVFPEGCKPVPLSESRRWPFPLDELRARAVAPVLIGMENPEAAMYRFAAEHGMLDKGAQIERTTGRLSVLSAAYKPTHGGYPDPYGVT